MPSPKTILGISAFYHDSAAFLLIDSEIVAASQEGRFSRIKHGNSDTDKNRIQKNDKEEEFQVKQGAKKVCLLSLTCYRNVKKVVDHAYYALPITFRCLDHSEFYAWDALHLHAILVLPCSRSSR